MLIYRAQFNLINSSLSKELRPDLKSDIVEGKLTPAEVALLTSEDLATVEQLAEIQAARDESLRQQKRIKEKADSVRVGRDGFEEVEDKEDREARQHRKEEEKPSEPEPFPTPTRQPAAVEASKSPDSESGTAEPTSPGRRRSSVNVSASPIAPRPSVSLNSAWGGKIATQHDDDMEIEDEQDKIDLSDIVPEDVEYGDGLDDVQAPDITEKSDLWTELLSKPVGWSGGVSKKEVSSTDNRSQIPQTNHHTHHQYNFARSQVELHNPPHTGLTSFPTQSLGSQDEYQQQRVCSTSPTGDWTARKSSS